MTVPVGRRHPTSSVAGDDATAPRELEFPRPRFPSGVAVPPAALLVVLLGAAGCLVTVHAHAGAAATSVPIAPAAVATAAAVAASALFGFLTLRAVVVKPVRRLRSEVTAVALGARHRRAGRRSAVREIARIGTAVGAQRARPSARRAWHAPMTGGLVLVAIVPLWALAASVALIATRQPANVAADPGLVTLVAAAAGCAVVLIHGYVWVSTVRPLQQAARQAEAIAAAGDGEQRTPEPIAPQRLDEVGAITAALNLLLRSAPRSAIADRSSGDGRALATAGR